MYESLRSWCTSSVGVVRPSTTRNAAGDITTNEPVFYGGYLVEKLELITDTQGKDAISSAQVYLPPEVEVDVSCLMILPGESLRREIKRISNFIDGGTGAVSIRLVYL